MSSLFKQLALQEKEIAEREGRPPRGWVWTEQMDAPRAIDFSSLEEEDEQDEKERDS